MKRYILVLLSVLICASTINYAFAKSTSNANLASAIKMYKTGNYTECYSVLSEFIKKEPSNAIAYYYLGMSSAQIGKQDEAIANYEKAIVLSPEGKLRNYAVRGKTCLEAPDKCNEGSETSMDSFIKGKFGTGFAEEVRSDYEKQKIENFMREMNRKNDIEPQKFKDYRDFSSEVPTNDEIVTALRVLQKAGLDGMLGSNHDLSLLTGSKSDMMDMLMGGNNNSNLSPQIIQSLLTNQMSF